MAFDSLAYGALLALTLALYWLLGPRLRLALLIAASLAFYAAWSVPLVSLIVLSAAVDYSCGLGLGAQTTAGRRRALLGLSLVVNLGVLGYFKYAGFFVESAATLLGRPTDDVLLNVVLPPGISFYTFQTLSYTIDVYRRRVEPCRSPGRFFLYVCFFPQLIAGPIERAGHLLGQFESALARSPRVTEVVGGLQLVVWGLFKKAVLADHCGRVADSVFARPGDADAWAALVGTYAFTMQIYFDFSAYSEIARGSARLFGIELLRNFDQPYLTTNISDFWRRWHISLSNWFRDYVYIPLGGSRGGRVATLRNLVITMFLSGLWHGAAWTFVAWGLLHGALLLVTVLAQPATRRVMGLPGAPLAALLLNLHLVALGWILFRAGSFADAWTLTAALSSPRSWLAGPDVAQLAFIACFFGFIGLSWVERRHRLLHRLRSDPTWALPLHAALLVAIALLGLEDGPAFIYFQL